MTATGVDIFQYTRYRHYFRVVYEDLKKREKAFSIRSFQRRAGFSDRSNHFWQILHGKALLNAAAADRYAHALGLDPEERAYLHLMVELEQAKDETAREKTIRAMTSSSRFLSENRYQAAAFVLFSDWLLPILWEAAALDTFREDPAWIAERFFTDISPATVRAALDKLLAHGFISRGNDGRLEQQQFNLTDYLAAARETNAEAITMRRAQLRKNMVAALEAMDRQPFDSRLFFSTAIPVSQELYDQMRQKVIALQEELRLIAAREPVRDAVYQLNIQFFAPFSS